MTPTNLSQQLQQLIDTHAPILYLQCQDKDALDVLIEQVREGRACLEFDNALGALDFQSKRPLDLEHPQDLASFLKANYDRPFEEELFLVLKDIESPLEQSPTAIALLQRMARFVLNNADYNATIFIFSSHLGTPTIPKELEIYTRIFDIPLPDKTQILATIKKFAKANEILLEEQVAKELALDCKGLREVQIEQILRLAYYQRGGINAQSRDFVIQEKEQRIKKTNLLEMVRPKEGEDLAHMGGLEKLKHWLQAQAHIIANLDLASQKGVDMPKGVLVVGVPGCGKSLSAKACAGLFKLPLVRLDVGRLFGKFIGQSEENMRAALQLAEAISPCVLWIDEIEKAFSGMGANEGAHEVSRRLFGHFLTWMEEKTSMVFIVATANDITRFPPEFLRKGRFDELFFVDLPGAKEREQILKIHLQKRQQNPEPLDLASLAKECEGFSGADLENLVKLAVQEAFIEKQSLTLDLLRKALHATTPITKTMHAKIHAIRIQAKKLCLQNAGETTFREETTSEGKDGMKCNYSTKLREKIRLNVRNKLVGALVRLDKHAGSEYDAGELSDISTMLNLVQSIDSFYQSVDSLVVSHSGLDYSSKRDMPKPSIAKPNNLDYDRK
ncbi:AAA family ATPase [Helicobacter ailurogastricus]|uniref:AAA family ATPase n=1 Tax=Helicobacter ailurogastricus TaxID=1578720 RepID=UPI00244D8043|nr:AAA family ATPase [Helicobacter ailurogastricus]GMB90612.1 AAA family ATPase [Helicobacter ailurogastricus]